MKKISTLLLLLIALTLFTGCNQRRGAIEKITMDGVYELAYFIDSNLNSNNTVFDPFEHYDRYAIEIQGTTLKTIIRSKNSQNNVITEYEIDQVTDLTFRIKLAGMEMSGLYYFNIHKGVIEFRSVGSSKMHYIYSKYAFDGLEIPNGTYELTMATGYQYGQSITKETFEYFEFYIKNNQISYKNKRTDGSAYRGSGTYIAGLSGIETYLADTHEYMHYDPVNKTLTFEAKYMYTDTALNLNYILVFELKK